MKHSVKAVLAATVLCFGALASLEASAQETCADVLATAPDELVLVQDIYGYLDRLDAAHCPHDVKGALDGLIDTRALNMVSFAMLEARLGRSDLATAESMLAETLDAIETANAGLDESGVLMLVDIAYRPCEGDEQCVGEKVSGWIGDRILTGDAACTFGLDQVCNSAERVPFLNSVTVDKLAVPDLRKARGAFVCARYGDCERGAF